jgi:hypothetical protein
MARPKESRRRVPEVAGARSSEAAVRSSGDGSREAIKFLRQRLDDFQLRLEAARSGIDAAFLLQTDLISV